MARKPKKGVAQISMPTAVAALAILAACGGPFTRAEIACPGSRR